MRPETILLIVLAFALIRYGLGGRRTRSGRRWSNQRRGGPLSLVPPLIAANRTDYASQLQTVMAAEFACQKIMSATEAKVFYAPRDAIQKCGLDWLVMVQVCLGEVLKSDDDAAHRAINCKRVDLLVVSSRGWPLLAIEYQGEGHYQGEAAARDAIKKEALRRAGVSYLEATPDHGKADIEREIVRLAEKDVT